MQEPTDDLASLERAIRSVRAQDNTTLYGALNELARQAAVNAAPRRQAIVLLSDGDDTASLIGLDDVLDVARRGTVSIYAIALGSRSAGMQPERGGRRYFSETDFAMKTLAEETGGRPFFPVDVRDLAGVYGSIAEDPGEQYALGYVPKNLTRDDKFRRILVRVLSRPDARPRTRTSPAEPAGAFDRPLPHGDNGFQTADDSHAKGWSCASSGVPAMWLA